LKIGLLYPTAGAQGMQGTEELHGAELAIQWANQHHVLGPERTIEAVVAPADRAEAVPSAFDTLQRDHVQLVVGSHGSSISAVAAAEATKRHLLFWETGAVGETDGGVHGGTNFIRMAPMGGNLGQSGIAFVNDVLTPMLQPARPLRYAVAYVDDPYGRAVAAGAEAEIEAAGLDLVGRFSYKVGDDYNAVVRRIAAAHPDALYVSAYLDDGVALRRALVAQHVPLLAAIGTSSSFCMPAFGQALGADAVGLYASDKPDAAAVRPEALRPEGRTTLTWVTQEYHDRYGEDPTAPALSGFANTYALLVHVLPAAPDGTPSQVARAAVRTKLPVGTLANGGGMDIAPVGQADAGNNRAAAGVIEEWVAPGRMVVVWPQAFAEHPVEVLPIS
jgi:ABC-type branched-subunit amino acid transport system substrate-binding protein